MSKIKVGQWYRGNNTGSYYKVTSLTPKGVCVDKYGIDGNLASEDDREYEASGSSLEMNYTLIKQPLCTMTMEEYNKVQSSGMMWVWYPESKGCYSQDVAKVEVEAPLEEYAVGTWWKWEFEGDCDYNLIKEIDYYGLVFQVYNEYGDPLDEISLDPPLGITFKKIQPSELPFNVENGVPIKSTLRNNGGKTAMKYWTMFPHAAKATCDRLEANEDQYPNDKFNDYNPQETAESLMRHLTDLTAPYPIFNPEETKKEHMAAIVFNALCMLESSISQGHEWGKE